MRQPDFESAIARLHGVWSELAVAVSAVAERSMEISPTLFIHHNSVIKGKRRQYRHSLVDSYMTPEFPRALVWANKHRPDLTAIYRRTKKRRTEKKCIGRIIKEWRDNHE